MGACSKAYLDEIIENQGKLFDYVAVTYPDMDTINGSTAFRVLRLSKKCRLHI